MRGRRGRLSRGVGAGEEADEDDLLAPPLLRLLVLLMVVTLDVGDDPGGGELTVRSPVDTGGVHLPAVCVV